MSNPDSRRCPNCRSERTSIDPGDCSQWYCFDCGTGFRTADEPESVASEPLKLFLSYGHPESEIALRIKETLEERGHKVWMDDEIKAGDDWREEIAKGVRSSDGVVACLSRHSVREDGVCRDELAIAVGDPRCRMTTVLLEDESKVDPPTTVSHVQWVDMHDWQERQENSESSDKSFDDWFGERMSELCQAVESEEGREASREMGKLLEALQPLVDDSKQRDLLSREFVGREWLTEEVVEWLDDRSTPRTCLLTGAPGAGKSAFAAHLAHYGAKLRACVAAALFCEANHQTYNDPKQVIRTLAYLLACKIPEYRADIAGKVAEKGWPDKSEDELFSFFLADPLAHAIDGNRECLCIIVDGLDEAGDSDTNALASVIGRYADRLPKWLKILVISRDVASVTAPLAGGAHPIDIDASSECNKEDVRAYLKKVLKSHFEGEPILDACIEAVAEASDGVMLYASTIADSLLKGEMSLEEASAELPKGLAGEFYDWFARAFPDIGEYKGRFRSEIGCLLAAPGGALPEKELELLSGRDTDTVNDFKLRLEVFLQESVSPLGGPALSISHAYLAEWLSSKEAGNYRAAKEAGIKKVGETFLNILRSDPRDLTDYEAAHMLDLLAQAGTRSEYEEACNSLALCDRVCDLCTSLFLNGKLPMAKRVANNASDHFRDFGCNAQLIKLAKSISAQALATRLEDPWDPMEADMFFDVALSVFDKLETSDFEANLSDLADAYSNFAGMYRDQAWNTQAETLAEDYFRRAYDVRKMLYEDDSGDGNLFELAESCSSLGQFLHDKHQFAEAEDFLRKSVGHFERYAKGNSESILPRLVESRVDLALLLQNEGKLDEAEKLHRQALSEYRELAENNPDDHLPNLADACFNVATLYMVTGKFDEAGELYIEYSETYRKLALDDPFTYSLSYAESGIYLARLSEVAGKPANAEDLYGTALDVFEQHPQANRIDYLVCRAESCTYLASLYESAKKLDEADRLYRDYIEICAELAESDPLHETDFPESYSSLASFYRRTGKLDEAEKAYRKVIEIYKEGFEYYEPGMFSLEIAAACIDLASVLMSHGNREEALSCYREAISECDNAEANDDPRRESKRNTIAEQAREQVRHAFGEDALESLQ